MEFDLGLQAILILLGVSLVFGVVAHLILGRETLWMWLVGAVSFFVGALLTSEWIFASATILDLQPQIDGLSLDEALLGGLIVGVPVVLVVWFVNRRRHVHGPSAI